MMMSIEVKYRPKKWEEIKGNKKVIEKIREMVENEKKGIQLMRNILFVGVPGTGKARLHGNKHV